MKLLLSEASLRVEIDKRKTKKNQLNPLNLYFVVSANFQIKLTEHPQSRAKNMRTSAVARYALRLNYSQVRGSIMFAIDYDDIVVHTKKNSLFRLNRHCDAASR